MPKHTWTLGVKSDAGKGPSITVPVYFSSEVNIGEAAAGQAGLVIAAGSVEKVNCVVTAADIQSMFMACTTDVRVRTNSETEPTQEFNFNKSQGLSWNSKGMPTGASCPVTDNITSLWIYNKGTVDGVTPSTGLKSGAFQAGFGVTEESLGS